ncbi:MAG: hypothetical protein M3Q07_23750 [Pseudobdellovibrionaceae bacterium]|nr:hypothetical protein [Pseudobdellovibrionaceae bacterium]
MRHSLLLSVSLAAGLATACGKTEDKDTVDAKIPSTIGELETKPGTLMIAMDSSIASVGTNLSGPIAGAPALRLADEGDIGCHDETNYPVDLKDSSKNNAQGFFQDSDPRYGAGRIYCSIANKTDNSASVQGAYFMPKVFACALSNVEDAALDGEDHDVTLTVTRECFGSLLDDPDTGLSEGKQLDVVVNATATPEVEGWDLDLKITADGSSFRMLFAEEKDKRLSFASYSSGTQSFGDDAVAVAVDMENGELRYAYRRMIVDCDTATGDQLKTCYGKSTDEQWQGTVHDVILAKGTVNASAEFTTLDSINGVVASTYSSNTDPLSYGGNVFTLQGTLTGGLTSRGYKSSYISNLETFLKVASFPAIEAATMCWKDQESPVAGACSGITGIEFNADAQIPYLLHPADGTVVRNKVWVENKPLDFTTIDLSNVKL